MTRRPRWTRLLALPAVVLLALAGCGSDDDEEEGAGDETEDVVPTTEDGEDGETEDTEGTEPTGGAGGDLTISDFAFQVPEVTAGSTVTVSNQDGVPHTVTADDGEFDTGRVEGGESAEFTAPAEPGEYAFHCEVHPSMTASLTVA